MNARIKNVEVLTLRNNQFVIICPARSGSTMLVHLLRSHPDIWCNGEVFLEGWRLGALQGHYARLMRSEPDARKHLEAQMNLDLTRFLYKYVLDSQTRAVGGFKFKLDEFVLPPYKALSELLVADKDLKILFLTRQNLLARYASCQVVNQVTGMTLLTDERERPTVEPLELSPLKCKEDFELTLRRQSEIRKLFSDHRCFELTYEQLMVNPTETHRGICQFLDVEYQEMVSRTLKILSPDLSRVVANLEEIHQFFVGSRFEQYIGSLSPS